jgi:hypothetical protein
MKLHHKGNKVVFEDNGKQYPLISAYPVDNDEQAKKKIKFFKENKDLLVSEPCNIDGTYTTIEFD